MTSMTSSGKMAGQDVEFA